MAVYGDAVENNNDEQKSDACINISGVYTNQNALNKID